MTRKLAGALAALTVSTLFATTPAHAVEPFPAGEPGADALDARPVARVRLAPGGVAPDPLFARVGAPCSASCAFFSAA
mgnify:CR=1 FL=1